MQRLALYRLPHFRSLTRDACAIDFSDKIIVFESLKQKRRRVYRAVPVPLSLLDMLDRGHGAQEIQRRNQKKKLNQLLWPWGRTTAWRRVTSVMQQAGILEGPHRVPKGLRHGYAIHALNKGVQLNLVSKWMGHAKLETTAIYANAVGEEQWSIAERMWT